MGGGRGGPKRGRTQRRHFRQSRENVWRKKNRTDPPPSSDNNSTWEPFVTQNPSFEEYYKEQGIVSEDEWDEFLAVLRKALPAAFRINSSGQFSKDIRCQLEDDFMKSLDVEVECENGNGEAGIRPLPWYPDKLAWQVNFSRMQLRKNQTLERFHEFLKQENEIGNITRQEAVSMVPPLFLDVQPDQRILDMCAAPGSKTCQLLEMIHRSNKPGSLPEGMVIANDVDFRRCNLLIHQTKRMCSANLIVTNHEAQNFPSCLFKPEREMTIDNLPYGIKACDKSQKLIENQLLFDRVLCDVPCSGDGTLRKAPDLWRKWNPGMGNGLHRLQVQIAMRGIALLKVGGRLVYSTCSMNPVEDEAVVAEILRRSGGSVELLDVSAELPQLIRRPGLKTWKVRDKGCWLTSYKEVPSNRKAVIVPSMFPSGQAGEPKEASAFGEEEISVNVNELETDTSLQKQCQIDENFPLERGNCDVGDGIALSKTCQENGTEKCCSQSITPGNPKPKAKEVSNFPLERCMRILPHDQNGGAFFIAVLQKISHSKDRPREQGGYTDESGKTGEPAKEVNEASCAGNSSIIANAAPSDDNGDFAEGSVASDSLDEQETVEFGSEADHSEFCPEGNEMEKAEECEDGMTDLNREGVGRGKLQIQGKWRGVDPVVFFMDDNIINNLRNFYGIDESLPFHGHLVTRNDDVHHVKRIYYTSKSVQDVLRLNFCVGQQLKITSLGLKTFERQTSKDSSTSCAFRISSEGLPLLLPYMTKQRIHASLKDFVHLLKYRTIKFADFCDAEFGEKASELSAGCCVVVLHKGEGPVPDVIVVDGSTIAIGCWKGRTNLSIMVSQVECQELLDRLSGQSSSLQETKDENHNGCVS
ncbi:uncharacterized protein LOC116258757 isoform X1 [Nymphaea colorata]|nr:uncharacterized protein LOC116258757 isoform X1 [Nymphaea colorata]